MSAGDYAFFVMCAVFVIAWIVALDPRRVRTKTTTHDESLKVEFRGDKTEVIAAALWKLQQENAELLELLCGCVAQGCTTDQGGSGHVVLDDGCISAYEDALAYLAERGIVEEIPGTCAPGRRGVYRWPDRVFDPHIATEPLPPVRGEEE
ncbi:MAG: hypothetical protein PHU75_03770 [Candidatus Nanopelagicales bacterium]|nr:hypothetical protein [Candidatus Nanopelagicales bacterium]